MEVSFILQSKFKRRKRCLKSVDDLVESIMNALNETDLLDDTYIMFSSDHGYHTGQFSLPYDKRQPYEFDLRIPLLIRGPGVKELVFISHFKNIHV